MPIIVAVKKVKEKGVIHLVLPLVLLLIIGAGAFALIYFGIIQNPLKKIPYLGQKQPTVAVKQEYKNPFNKDTQYVNPFQTNKNPFVTNR